MNVVIKYAKRQIYFDEKKMRHSLKYSMGVAQMIKQNRRSFIFMEKVRAATIMQAWADGFIVNEYQDELILTKPE
jgi:hypothetical protein